jgi:hypothetical protein
MLNELFTLEMLAIIFFNEMNESPALLTICEWCGRRVRIDSYCGCGLIFFDVHYKHNWTTVNEIMRELVTSLSQKT